MPYLSRNPILATASSTDPFERVEIEVYIENVETIDTFASLGTFSFISNALGDVEERIDSILHAAMMSEIGQTVPDMETEAQRVEQLSRKYYYRHRHYTSDAWTSWTSASEDFVVLGGEPHEEFSDQFTINAPLGPTFLHPEGNLLALSQAQAWVYVLAHTSGTATITHRYWNKAETVSNTEVTTFSVSRAFNVFRIPVVNPLDTKSPFFGIEVEIDDAPQSISLVLDDRHHRIINEFAYLNSRGGWNFLPCHAAMGKSLDVVQQVAETTVGGFYFNQSDISQYKVWDSQGRKKFRVATGYWPSAYLDVVTQDFLLSRYRFWWNADLSKWMPIIVETKSATYAEDGGGDLQSMQFEFRLAFDNDIPSAL